MVGILCEVAPSQSLGSTATRHSADKFATRNAGEPYCHGFVFPNVSSRAVTSITPAPHSSPTVASSQEQAPLTPLTSNFGSFYTATERVQRWVLVLCTGPRVLQLGPFSGGEILLGGAANSCLRRGVVVHSASKRSACSGGTRKRLAAENQKARSVCRRREERTCEPSGIVNIGARHAATCKARPRV